MALDFKHIPIVMSGGVKDYDEYLRTPPNQTRVENGVLDSGSIISTKAVAKRESTNYGLTPVRLSKASGRVVVERVLNTDGVAAAKTTDGVDTRDYSTPAQKLAGTANVPVARASPASELSFGECLEYDSALSQSGDLVVTAYITPDRNSIVVATNKITSDGTLSVAPEDTRTFAPSDIGDITAGTITGVRVVPLGFPDYYSLVVFSADWEGTGVGFILVPSKDTTSGPTYVGKDDTRPLTNRGQFDACRVNDAGFPTTGITGAGVVWAVSDVDGWYFAGVHVRVSAVGAATIGTSFVTAEMSNQAPGGNISVRKFNANATGPLDMRVFAAYAITGSTDIGVISTVIDFSDGTSVGPTYDPTRSGTDYKAGRCTFSQDILDDGESAIFLHEAINGSFSYHKSYLAVDGSESQAACEIMHTRFVSGTSPPTEVANGLWHKQLAIHSMPLRVEKATGFSRYTFPVLYPSAWEPSVLLFSEGYAATSYTPSTNELPLCVEGKLSPGFAGTFALSSSDPGVTSKTPVPSTTRVSYYDLLLVPHSRSVAPAKPLFLGGSLQFAPTQQLVLSVLELRNNKLGHVEESGGTVAAGACPHALGTTDVFQAGFLHAPVISAITKATSYSGGESGTADAYLDAGTYLVRCTYSYTDEAGNYWESAPSTPKSMTSASDFYGYQLTMLPYLSERALTLNVFRTDVGADTGFYRDVLAGGVYYGITNTLLQGSEPLYTDSEEPDALWQPSRVVWEHGRRLFVTDGRTLYWTKTIEARGTIGSAPSMMPRDAHYLAVPDAFGRAVAGVSLDDKCVVFCEKKIGAFYGDGPDAAGGGATFSPLVEAVSGYGQVYAAPNAVLRTDDGVWFQSQQGLRFLTRGLAIARDPEGIDLGAAVDSLVSGLTVTRFVRNPIEARIYVYFRESTLALVLDENSGSWSTLVLPVACRDAIYDESTSSPCVLGTDGYLYTMPTFKGTSATPTMVVETAWLPMGGLQGFQRVTHLMLLAQMAKYVSGTSYERALTLEVAYDYGTTWTTLAGNGLSNTATYVSGQPVRMQAEWQLPVQKCEAIKFRITSSATVESSFRITALSLRVGVKQGRFKAPTRK